MSTVSFEVLHSEWGAGENDAGENVVYPGGLHEDVPATPELLQLLAGAEAAGAVVIVEISKSHRKAVDACIQSQEDGEAALKQAMGTWVVPVHATKPDGSRSLVELGYWTGPWRHGNLAQFVVSCEDRLGYDDQLPDDDEDKLDPGDRAAIVHALDLARGELAKTEEPT